MKATELKIFLFRIIPTGLISRIFGVFTRIRLPKFILDFLIDWFCRKYSINMDEISYPEFNFKTFDEFFTRGLKTGVHTIDKKKKSIISPVDSRIDQFGKIDRTTIIQAKGIEYSLEDLVPSETYSEFIDGSFITLYLSPSDYHRIHSPVKGIISGFFYIPGRLFTVQEFMVNGLKGLFTKNERLISYIKNDNSLVAVCKIGAMNVGRITVSYSEIKTNSTKRKVNEFFFHEKEMPNINKGDELAVFHLGSTIILLFQKDTIRFEDIKVGDTVRVGEKIANFI